jgi:hypothetical protein
MLPISNKAVEMLENFPKTGERDFKDGCNWIRRSAGSHG